MMSFLFINSQKTLKHQKKNNRRKEEDSTKTQSITSYFPKKVERASLFTSFKGSITVEASMAVPLFFLAICCLCYLLEVMSIQMTIRSALDEIGRKTAEEIYVKPFIFPGELEEKMVAHIGKERLDRSVIADGSQGLDLSGTTLSGKSKIIKMCVEYKIKLPVYTFGKLALSCKEEFRLKSWTGYEKEFGFQDKEDIVYVTETGMVYHRDNQCTYLDLSIRTAGKKDIAQLRNENGEKYRTCEKCGKKAGKNVYITNQGNRYHSSIGCSGLKRKIYAIPISEAQGKGECSRCGE
ncbi:hypothetical protein JCM37172_06330 [Faecalimonas hominis]|mgnify:FL=1|jgi:hypothetical protein